MEKLTLQKFEEAAEKVKEVTLQTNLVYSEYFSAQSGNKVYLKPENMQYTGAYKVRGAYYKISTMSEEERKKGLITASAGNHAQGGGLAAARGADEDDELLILDLQVEVGNSRSSSARIDLVDVLAANRSHRSLPPLKFFYVTAP